MKKEEIEVIESKTSCREHYTKITIRKLNKKISGSRTIGKVKELLSSIYREDIRSGIIKIYYNDTLLQFKEAPLYEEETENGLKTWKKDVSFNIEHENKLLSVNGFIALRIPGSVKDAGLTLIRRGRVIIGGSENTYRPSEIFGDSNSYAWQRLYGELHMDNWPVTQAKDNFDWHNSGLEEVFIKKLEPLTEEYRRKAEKIRVRERINATDLACEAIKSLSDSGLLTDINVKIVDRRLTQPDEDILQPKMSLTESAVDGVDISGGNQIDYKFKYRDVDYYFHVVFDTTDPSLHWLIVEPNGGSEFTISNNC